jgi:hypothetical protein
LLVFAHGLEPEPSPELVLAGLDASVTSAPELAAFDSAGTIDREAGIEPVVLAGSIPDLECLCAHPVVGYTTKRCPAGSSAA